MSKWDKRFINLAQHVAGWSKDPSTKVGAVITYGNQIVSLGYNGLPIGVADTPERLNNRDIKIQMVLHAEQNAILTASRPLAGCTLYCWPLPPCSRCSAEIIQAGIARVVAPPPSAVHADRWATDLSGVMFSEALVDIDFYGETMRLDEGAFPCTSCKHHENSEALWCSHTDGPVWQWGLSSQPTCENRELLF